MSRISPPTAPPALAFMPLISSSHLDLTRSRRLFQSVEVFSSDFDFNVAYRIQSEVSAKVAGSVMSEKG